MKRNVAKLTLSPNEEARIIREEHERRRKLRIQQVRQQQRDISLELCRAVERRRHSELRFLGNQLRADWDQQQAHKLQALQTLYEESLLLIGQAHRNAKKNEPNLAAIAQREAENHSKADNRYREALKELKRQKIRDHERHSRSINARKRALQTEKERSENIANLPPPPPNPIQKIVSIKQHVVKKSDVSAFASTHYHMSESAVDRETHTPQVNACDGAELEAKRLDALQREEKMRREEQLERARLRGRQALNREHLIKDQEGLLVELEHMQQTDLLNRRQKVFQMPAQIFQPLYQRNDPREDFQRQMEFAFEDIYTWERRVKGDLVMQLMPEPLPALSTSAHSQDQELDVTMEEIHTQDIDNAEVFYARPAPRQALKKLLDRIRSQRSQQTVRHPSDLPDDVTGSTNDITGSPNDVTGPQNVPYVILDEIPERDTTINTGSLTSEEPLQPPVLEKTEQNAPLPNVPSYRNQLFEEEQKRREEELEMEKEKQLLLIEELEEHKVKLEQMLAEAQQEREDLKAAGTQQQESGNQFKGHIYEQDVPHVNPGLDTELVPPADEDDHSRIIREYQQQLLEQNRVHQRTVEVARQRLEEYQRALQIRYNMTVSSQQPSVGVTDLINSQQHNTQHLHIPVPLDNSQPLCIPVPSHKTQPLQLPTQLNQPTPHPGTPSQYSTQYLNIPIHLQSTQHPNLPTSQPSTQTLNPQTRLNQLTPRLNLQSLNLNPPPSFHGAQPLHIPTTLNRNRHLNFSTLLQLHASLNRSDPQPLHIPVTSLQSTQPLHFQTSRTSTQPVHLPTHLNLPTPLHSAQPLHVLTPQLKNDQLPQNPQSLHSTLVPAHLKSPFNLPTLIQFTTPLNNTQALQLQTSEPNHMPVHPSTPVQLTTPLNLPSHQQSTQPLHFQTFRNFSNPLHSSQPLHIPTPLKKTQSFHLQTPLQMPLQTSAEVPNRELNMATSLPHPSRSILDSIIDERADLSTLQTADIMERVTEHLPERLRTSEVPNTSEPHKLFACATTSTTHLPGSATPVLVPGHTDIRNGTLKTGSVSSTEDYSMKMQKQEMQDVQKRILEQKNQEEERQRLKEEERQRREVQMEQMRRQKETLQSLIQTDAQSVPDAASGALPSGTISQTRLRLLKSLLRAIEETNGGTLSHLEEPQDKDGTPKQPSVPSDHKNKDPILSCRPVAPPHRVLKPPVSRVRPELVNMMSSQHELSTIQEVETPINTSLITDSVLRIMSSLSSDFGRGKDFSAPNISESADRRPDSECLFSTTISTGSYATSNPEQNSYTSPAVSLVTQREWGSDTQDVSLSSSGPSVSILDSSAEFVEAVFSDSSSESNNPNMDQDSFRPLVGRLVDQSSCLVADDNRQSDVMEHPSVCVEAVFNESSIQCIIDRYTRELNISLNTTGRHIDIEDSYLGSSVSQGSLVPGLEDKRGQKEENSANRSGGEEEGTPSDAAQSSVQESDNPNIEHFSDQEVDQDSFRPLIGRLTNQSSCLVADDNRQLAMMDRLLGQPSAHSSMIHGGWDSTLSRMIGWLLHQSSSHWLSGGRGRDFYACQLVGHMMMKSEHSMTTWFNDDSTEESGRMRQQDGEMYTSERSGERIGMDLGVSTEANFQTFPVLPFETQSYVTPVPSLSPHTQDQTRPKDLALERTKVFPGSDSFHPLMAEVTNNETETASISFLPENILPFSLEAHTSNNSPSVSARSEQSEFHNHASAESEPSPECFRAEETFSHVTVHRSSRESFSQLVTSQDNNQESIMVLATNTETDVEITTACLSHLSMCDSVVNVDVQQPGEINSSCERFGGLFKHIDSDDGQLQKDLNWRDAVPLSDEIMDRGNEKGILEQSGITLVSLTNTAIDDQETVGTDEDRLWDQSHPDKEKQEAQKDTETEAPETMFIPDEAQEDQNQKNPGNILAIEWDLGRDLKQKYDQKRRALLQKSSQRVAEMKRKCNLSNNPPETQAEMSRAEEWTATVCETKTMTGPALQNKTKAKQETDEWKDNQKSDFKQKKTQISLPQARDSRQKKAEAGKSCSPEQQKKDVLEMHLRTRRLYDQLEEVKHQKEMKSRKDCYAQNRMKAAEFNKKTLQKLRAKQTLK